MEILEKDSLNGIILYKVHDFILFLVLMSDICNFLVKSHDFLVFFLIGLNEAIPLPNEDLLFLLVFGDGLEVLVNTHLLVLAFVVDDCPIDHDGVVVEMQLV